MKFNVQYDEQDISFNFDIVSLHIYNENAVGRIRDLSILNRCRHPERVEILGACTCWIALAHIVNLTKNPVGPKKLTDVIEMKCVFHIWYILCYFKII